MSRFPDSYEKPALISLDDATSRGWTAACTSGTDATSGGCAAGWGNPVDGGKSGDGFIDPEVFNQGV